MGIFDHFKPKQPIGGYIGFYGLADWWFSEFTEEERRYLVERDKWLTWGKVNDSNLPVTTYLYGLYVRLKSAEDSHIAKRIYKKIDELGRLNPIDKPGNYLGRHYTTYLEEIKELKRSNSIDELERLLLGLIDAVEAESKAYGYGLASHYTEQLAILYRKQGDYFKEIKILSRYIWSTQKADNPQIGAGIVERLEKAKLLHNKASQKKG